MLLSKINNFLLIQYELSNSPTIDMKQKLFYIVYLKRKIQARKQGIRKYIRITYGREQSEKTNARNDLRYSMVAKELPHKCPNNDWSSSK